MPTHTSSTTVFITSTSTIINDNLENMETELSKSTSALFAIAAWLAMHRLALNRGFLLTRQGLSTDTIFGLIIGISTSAWTLNAFFFGAEDQLRSMLTRAAHAPLLLQTLSIFWLLSYVDGLIASRRGYESFALWKLESVSGPFDWRRSVKPTALWTLHTIQITVISATSLSAINDGYKAQGVLNIVGLAVFLMSGTRDNPYINARHRYRADMLRIVLPTSHHEGTAYILPSAGSGFDAVWSPKVTEENIEADQQAMELFRSLRSEKWPLKEPLERIRHIVSSYQERVSMTPSELEELARWLYMDTSESTDAMRPMRCARARDTHLIGRDLMYALCHAEYLVFMGQGRLSLEMQHKLGSLRLMKRSGAGTTPSADCVGYKPGLEGYREAVEYVYALFNEPLDESTVTFACSPPEYSHALSQSPMSTEEYVAKLWDTCCKHSESTFTALYMFTLVWSIEMGNVNGFHLFPLRCRNREGDTISQQIVWRQAWYSGVICQLISVSPILFAAFTIGYME